VVRGANAPLIMRTITEQLAHEHRVVDGQAERKEVRFHLFLMKKVEVLKNCHYM